MSDSQMPPSGDEPEAPPRTPFDNPFFLPVLLWIFAAWFGYDGWFNPEMEWINFNRYGFAIIVVLALYTTVKARRERRDEAERFGDGTPPEPPSGE